MLIQGRNLPASVAIFAFTAIMFRYILVFCNMLMTSSDTSVNPCEQGRGYGQEIQARGIISFQ